MGQGADVLRKIVLKYVKIGGVEIQGETLKSFSIFESITQPAILGEIVFADWQGLNEFGQPFAGDDVEIEFWSEDKPALTLKYKLYAAENIQAYDKQTYKTIQYKFCSPWLIHGLGRNITKPYKNKFVHEIIADLLTQCGASIGFIEPTKQKLENFVAPLWTPIHTIRHLMSFAINSQKIGGYVLFTDMKTGKVNCCTIDHLYKKSLGYWTGSNNKGFMYHPINTYYDGKIHQMTFENNYDLIRHLGQGMNKIENHSFWFDKNKYITTKDTIKDYKHTHLSTKFPVNAEYLDKKWWNKRDIMLYPRRAEAIVSEMDLQDYVMGNQHQQYTMLFSDVFKINILTQGESQRRAGWVAKLNVPSQKERDLSAPKFQYDDYEGDYLIRDIKHIYQDSLYYQAICLAADGYKKFKKPLITW